MRFAQFYARQFSSLAGFYPVGVVLKWRGRLRACSQRLSRRFNTIAPLGAEACQWLFSLSYLQLVCSKSAKAQNCLHSNQLNCLYIHFTRILQILKMATLSSTARRGRSCAGPQIMSQPLKKNLSNIVCGPAQDRPLLSADLAGSNYQLMDFEILIVFFVSFFRLLPYCFSFSFFTLSISSFIFFYCLRHISSLLPFSHD